MVELIEYIAKSIVEFPDKVLVTKEETEKGIELKLSVDNKDMGRIIGRGGKIANAMRTVLKAISTKENKAVFLEIVEDE